MANNLGAVADKYTARLDQVVVQDSCTTDLTMNQDLLGEMDKNGCIEIATIAMDGLADHTRGGGFVKGGVKLEWTKYQLEFERDREFSIDSMEDQERELIISANLMGEFAREKVVPEVDAVRFARMTANSGTTAYNAAFATPQAAFDALELGEEAVQDNGAALSGCLLYCTSAFKGMLRKAQPYQLGQGENPNGTFTTFDEMKVVTVPKDRFMSAVDLLDGTTDGETEGGYKASTGSMPINFMIVDPRAVAAITKHQKLRYFSPDINQDDDAHKWQYRLYHDLLVYAKKKGLIYTDLAGAKPTTA